MSRYAEIITYKILVLCIFRNVVLSQWENFDMERCCNNISVYVYPIDLRNRSSYLKQEGRDHKLHLSYWQLGQHCYFTKFGSLNMLNHEIIDWAAKPPPSVIIETDPAKACLVIIPAVPNACAIHPWSVVNSTSNRGSEIHAPRKMVAAWLRKLSHWHSGIDGANHLLLDYYDIDIGPANRIGKKLGSNNTLLWDVDYPHASLDAGNAMVLGSSLFKHTIRKGFDVPIVLSQVSPDPDMPVHMRTFVSAGSPPLAVREKGSAERTKLVCFYGSVYQQCCEVRRVMANVALALHNKSIFDFDKSISSIGHDYSQRLSGCEFGLVLRGTGYHSFRLLEVLAAGAIPVIINDDGALPFEDDWQWDSFSVLLSETKTIISHGKEVFPHLRKLMSNMSHITEMRRIGNMLFESYLSTKSKLWSYTFDTVRRNVERERSTSPKCQKYPI